MVQNQNIFHSIGELRGLMGVKDFCASVTPGSKPSELFGACNYKILPTGYERSQDIFEQQKVDTSPNGGVLNQVKSSDEKLIVLLFL